VRLKSWEIEVIKNNAKKVFGNDVIVKLFGSRIDDNKRGGDIDLYIITKNNSFEKQRKFWSLLQIELGEQKIDIIYNENKNREIEKVANQGIIL